MRYFLDTEFYHDGTKPVVLSLSIVCEDGRQLYLVNDAADRTKADAETTRNVVPKLNTFRYEPGLYVELCSPAKMCSNVLDFCNYGGHRPVFWSMCACDDWVNLRQILGTKFPKHWPAHCRSLKQLLDMAGNPIITGVRRVDPDWHALFDARYERAVFDWLSQAVTPAAKQELFRHI